MASYCPKCGNQVAEGDQFCRSCGAALKASAPSSSPQPHGRWEYKDVVIPLNIHAYNSSYGHKTAKNYATRIGALISQALEKYGREGWELEGSSDVDAIIDRTLKYKLTWMGMGVVLQSVSLHLRRFTS